MISGPEHEASYYNPFLFVSDPFSSLISTYLDDGRSPFFSSSSSIFADISHSPVADACFHRTKSAALDLPKLRTLSVRPLLTIETTSVTLKLS